MGGGILLGLSLELTLMEDERRTKKKGSRMRGQRVSGGFHGKQQERGRGGCVSHEMSKMPLPLFIISIFCVSS